MLKIWSQNAGFKWVLAAALVSLAMRVGHLNQEFTGYHSWRQTQTQTTILNFAFEDANILNPRIGAIKNGSSIERMEFPLMQWIHSFPYRFLGDIPLYSRVLSFLTGLISLFVFYHCIINLGGQAMVATLGTICLVFSPLFYYYSINPMPDNMALMFGLMGLAILSKSEVSTQSWLLAVGCISLASACKLPFITFAPALVPWLWNRFRTQPLQVFAVALAGGLLFAPIAAWYVWVMPTWKGNAVLTGGWHNPTETLDILKVVWTMMLPEMILNYAAVPFFLVGLWRIFRHGAWKNPRYSPVLLCVPAVIAYYLFEMHAIGRGHDYYLMPFVPFLFLGIAAGIGVLIKMEIKYARWVMLPMLVLPVTCYLKADVRWKPTGLNAELVNHAAQIRAAVPLNTLCVVGNDESQRIFLYHLRKHGWSFMNDDLDPQNLQQLIDQGATVFVSTSEAVERNPAIQELLGPVLYTSPEVRAYSLEIAEKP